MRRHLRRNPGDYVGAQAVLLRFILGEEVSTDDPAFAATRANAEAMIRDEPDVPVFRFRRRDLAGSDLTVAVGTGPVAPIRIAARRISSWAGTAVVYGEAGHEVYLSDPDVLTGMVAGRDRRL